MGGILVEADAARGLETGSAGGKTLQHHSTNLSGTSIANGFLLLRGSKNSLYRRQG